jgi:uncharacterized protein
MDNFILLLSLAVVQGITSSLHCVTMCGPLLGMVTENGKNRWINNGIYQFGRLFSYSFLGIILGLSGKGADSLGEMTQIQWLSGILSGGFLIVSGLNIFFGKSLFHTQSLPYLQKLTRPIFGRNRDPQKNSLFTAFLIGSLSALLPCGVLYPAYALAFSSGNPLGGGIVMVFFFMGTFPALFFAGAGISWIRTKIHPGRLSYLGLILVLLGMGTVFMRVNTQNGSSHCHTPAHSLHK